MSHEYQHSSARDAPQSFDCMRGLLSPHGVCEFVSLSPPLPTLRDVEKHSFEMNHVICTPTIGNWILVCDGGGMVGKWHGIWRLLKKPGTLHGYNHTTKELWPDELRPSIHDYWDLSSNKSSMEKCLIAPKRGNKGLMLNTFMHIN